MSEVACENCRFFSRDPDLVNGDGYCVKALPRVIDKCPNGDYQGVWPTVFRQEFCGEFRPQGTHKDEALLSRIDSDNGLSVRAQNALKGLLGWNTRIGALQFVSRTELIEQRNCGKTVLSEVDDLCRKFGIEMLP